MLLNCLCSRFWIPTLLLINGARFSYTPVTNPIPCTTLVDIEPPAELNLSPQLNRSHSPTSSSWPCWNCCALNSNEQMPTGLKKYLTGLELGSSPNTFWEFAVCEIPSPTKSGSLEYQTLYGWVHTGSVCSSTRKLP
ncbi:hypothetical protein OGAPHI_005228 [Ogataea philodendri]|uniref:Secreted protein n=1 Tax=Ogataea philodendri TaxID=1378263 RepID=A0A9P8P1Z9_9ASCO|nr:uncharacterized protein OGAPHI_005228 [Ogataea philodendri]KAH3663825.1 hypothetical protein OGAPHI_005228 [Ogataea philodendri]